MLGTRSWRKQGARALQRCKHVIAAGLASAREGGTPPNVAGFRRNSLANYIIARSEVTKQHHTLVIFILELQDRYLKFVQTACICG